MSNKNINTDTEVRRHRLETMVGCNSRRWNRDACGREQLLREVLDSPGKLCYGDREVVAFLDSFEWQRLSTITLPRLSSLLDAGKFIKIALIESGIPTGERENDGVEGSSFE